MAGIDHRAVIRPTPISGAARFLTLDEAAEFLRLGKASIYERTRKNAIPYRRLPGTRRCLFETADLEAWIDGAALEVVKLADGGKIVRPVSRG